MFWWLLSLSVALGSLYYHWKRRWFYQIAAEHDSKIRSYPFIGHGHLLHTYDSEAGEVWFKSFGRAAIDNGGLSTFWIGNKLYLNSADPDVSEVVMKTCMEKGYVTQFIRTVIGNGSIFAAVDIWRPRRKILAPVFSMKNLNQFVKVFDQQSRIMTECLKPMAGAGDFSIWDYINTYTFDSVCETTMGIILNSQKNPDHKFLAAFDYLSQRVAERMMRPWLHPDCIYKRLPLYKDFTYHTNNINEFIDEIIQTKREELEAIRKGEKEAKVGDKTFLEMVIESSERFDKKYTDLELREEAMVIVMAGTDTSAVGASFATAMLARYPKVQEKIHKELDGVFGGSDRALTVEDLPNLKYLEAVVKESLRLYPPVPVTAREVLTEFKIPSGTTLVPGMTVVMDIWATHRNPLFWGADAELFRPERFLEGTLKHPSQFQPFSLPMRNCLGYNYAMMSMKTLMANFLRKYRILPPSGMTESQLKEPLKVTFDIMMRDLGNYVIRLEEK